jgi:hypothetical protein
MTRIMKGTLGDLLLWISLFSEDYDTTLAARGSIVIEALEFSEPLGVPEA